MRFAFVVLLVLMTTVGAARAGATPRPGGPAPPLADTAVAFQMNIAHNGVQSTFFLPPPLTKLWQRPLGGPVSYPLIAGGLVFVTVGNTNGSYGTTLYALRASTGATVWSRPIAGTYYWSAATYELGKLFVLNTDGLLRAFDAASGDLLWAKQMPDQWLFMSPPTADGGVVYVVGAGIAGTLYAVSETSGAILWQRFVMNGGPSAPTLSDGRVYVSYTGPQVYAFSRPDGAPVWHYSGCCEGGDGRTSVYAAGRLFTRDFFGNDVFDVATGHVIGTLSSKTPAAIAGDLAITTSADGTGLAATNLASGARQWSFVGDGSFLAAPIVVGGGSSATVYDASSSGQLYAIGAASGQVLWSTGIGVSVQPPDEENLSRPLSGLAAGDGILIVPGSWVVTAYG